MYNKKKHIIILIFFIISFIAKGYAQDLNQIGKGKNPFTLGGNLSANSMAYVSNGEQRRQPFTYFLSGGINMSFLGISFPFTISYSNQNFAYTQPFNIYAVHPSYKWVKAHAGLNISTSFSPYTLNGHPFTGGAIELAPTKGGVKIQAMYGRMLKAVEPDSLGRGEPAFKRMGYGLKTTYENKGYKIGLQFFAAKDEVNSLATNLEALENVLPKQNVVIGIDTKIPIVKGLTIEAEFAASAVTENIKEEKLEGDYSKIFFFGKLLNQKPSTSLYKALKTKLNYSAKSFSIGATYERIDPNYKTLGAYYFTNDFENVAININQKLAKNKVNIGLNLGIQRDDLENKKSNKNIRVVAAANLNAQISKKVQMQANYNNFQSYTKVKPDFLDIYTNTNVPNIDTFNYIQIAQSASLNLNYLLQQTKEKSQNMSMMTAFQQSAEKRGEQSKNTQNYFINGNIQYGYNAIKKNFGFSTGFNANYINFIQGNSMSLAPTISINKSFFDKQLKSTMSFAYNISFSNKQKQTGVFVMRWNNSYTLNKKHNFSLNINQMLREKSETQKLFVEFTANTSYSYSFSVKKKNKKTDEVNQ